MYIPTLPTYYVCDMNTQETNLVPSVGEWNIDKPMRVSDLRPCPGPTSAHGLPPPTTPDRTTFSYFLQSVSQLVATEDATNHDTDMKLTPTTVCILSVFGIVLFQVDR